MSTSNPAKNLQEDWKKYLATPLPTQAAWKEFNAFHAWLRSINGVENLTLEHYTNLKKRSDGQGYFTNWLERETEQCGKFRTASSYAYGIYRTNVDGEEAKYLTMEQRSGKKERLHLSKLDAEKYFESEVKPMLLQLMKFEDLGDEAKAFEINYSRKIAYMFNPGRLIPIYKRDVISAIAKEIGISDIDSDSYKATEHILNELKKKGWAGLDNKFDAANSNQEYVFDITQKLMSFLWERFGKSFPLPSKNIIFHGAPGTGKTYSVIEGIKQQIKREKNDDTEVFDFAQFHPSYTYEDFIEGLKPEVKDGGINLKLQPGKFKQLCKKAMSNLLANDGDLEKAKKYYFIADEINRAELSRVLGEVLVCLEESKRLRVIVEKDKKERKIDGLKLKTQYAHLDNEKDAVLTENGIHYFGVPENVYFIGTMNDIDRSVDSFDFALRRRFVWKQMDCDYQVLADELGNKEFYEKYIDGCKALNKLIEENAGWGLGSSYQIGHAYFLAIDNRISKRAAEKLFNEKLRPLLREYLRSEVPSEKEREDRLKTAQTLFLAPFSAAKSE